MAKLTINEFSNDEEKHAYYLKVIDQAAEEARLRSITPGAGQAMTYEAKYQEALVGSGVLLSAEAEVLGLSVQEVVASVLQARQRWQVVNAQIEAKRLKAKKEIREASTAAQMHAVEKTFRAQVFS